MENLRKIKMTDLTDERLKIEELGVITGGNSQKKEAHNICPSHSAGDPICCDTYPMCTSGIGPCETQT
ncbi:MAG: hypothetical protein LBH91_03780 [Prevotellaceae bacterium]|jgi:hypothetical protein|nr:hypothetical protein [Prevotellaceae bacterium]